MAKGLSGTIRLRYSGLVAFGSKIFSMVTGIVFVAIVTRNLSVADFGVWQYLSLILSYVIFPSSSIAFWITRFSARGYSVGKNGILSNLILSLPFFVVFLLISRLASTVIGADVKYFYMISVQVILVYLLAGLSASAYARHPHLVGYAEVVFESVKIAFAFLLFFILHMELVGAIFAVILAYAGECLFLFLLLQDEIREETQWSMVKKWFSHLWMPLQSDAVTVIYNLDLLILALVVHIPEPLALYRAAFIVAVTITYTSSLAMALYPKLLGGGGSVDVEGAFKLCFTFAIPMTVGVFILAAPILNILKAEYVIATPLLRIMAVWAPINILTSILGLVIMGGEKVDVDINASSMQLVKSKLFGWYLLRYCRAGLTLPLVYIFIVILSTRCPDQLILYSALGCFLANLVGDIFLCINAYRMAKKVLEFRFPRRSVIRFMAASAVMGLCVWLLNPVRITETILTILAGIAIYFTVLFLIDVESRELFRKIWNYIFWRTTPNNSLGEKHN